MNIAGPLPSALSPLARIASWGYWLGVHANSTIWNFRTPGAAGVPVVSVGNVSAGGTGKTPFVRWCVEALRASGKHPAIALRGYKSVGGISDEAEEYRTMLPDVPVAVGANRLKELAKLRREHPHIDCAVLDDAFQHRAIARDLDIVLVDATRPAIDGRLLPAGWLREPATALRRADLVVVTRAQHVDQRLSDLIESFHGKPPVAWTMHEWIRIERFGVGDREMPLASLNGKRVVIASALARPDAFVDDALRHGVRLVGDMRFPDHHPFTDEETQRIAARARSKDAAVLCSGKDWAKLRGRLTTDRGAEWLVVRAGIKFVTPEAPLRQFLADACVA